MFGKEKTFQEITGMTEDEFKAQAAEVKALRDSQTAKDAEIAEFRDSLAQTKADLASLRNPAPVQNNNEARKPASFYEDAEQAFTDRIAPLAQHTLSTNARLEQMMARQKFGREYQLWGKEIDAMVDAHQNMAEKGNPALYENIVNIVKGKHMDEILEAERKGSSLFTESGSSANVGSSSEKSLGLNNDQIAAAKRMGMTPEEFSSNYNAVMESRGMKVGHA
jgi:hypothetical protein